MILSKFPSILCGNAKFVLANFCEIRASERNRTRKRLITKCTIDGFQFPSPRATFVYEINYIYIVISPSL